MNEASAQPPELPDARGISHKGACHCGAVRFSVRLVNGFATARRCDCTYCSMRGAIAVSARVEDFEITSGAGNLSLYQFNTGTAKHHFCKTCGIYTHHQRRSNPLELGINVACLEGVSPFDFPSVDVFDGQSHPSDTKAPARLAGVLRFDRTT